MGAATEAKGADLIPAREFVRAGGLKGGNARAARTQDTGMDALTAFGLFAVTGMLVCYAVEDRSRWFVLGFAIFCALGSAYGFLQGAWPFGLVEAIWAVVAYRRWNVRGTFIAASNSN
jgi:hypothetical protein